MDSGSSPSLFCSVGGCKRVPDPGRRKCEQCLAYMRKYKAEYRKKAKPPGTCTASDCKNQTDGVHKLCVRCITRTNALSALPKHRAAHRDRYFKVREEALLAYGGKCLCCKNDNLTVLTFDHIDGNGEGPRAGGGQMAAWLKRNNYPDTFRVLCFTCNFVLGHHGYCPHSDLTQRKLAGRPRIHEEVPGDAAKRREYVRQYKIEVLSHYGELKCLHCSESNLECLTIDHIEQDGAEHRRKDKSAKNLYIWLKTQGYPPGYRILCFNCNYLAFTATQEAEGAQIRWIAST